MSTPADEEMEPNSAEGSDNEYDENDSFLGGEEDSDYEPDSYEESAEETDDDDPDYEPEDDLDELQTKYATAQQEIAALKALVRSYEHEIKALQSQAALKKELGH